MGSNRDSMPLAFMRSGESGVLVEIRGLRHHDHGGEGAFAREGKHYRRGRLHHDDRGHRMEHRLNHMGLIPGQKVKVIRNNAPGPILIAVKDSRFCLGRGIAAKLQVRPDGDGDI